MQSRQQLGVAFADAQVTSRNMVVDVDHPKAGRLRCFGNPVKITSPPAHLPTPASLREPHTDEVLTEDLGYSPERMAPLREQGVIVRGASLYCAPDDDMLCRPLVCGEG